MSIENNHDTFYVRINAKLARKPAFIRIQNNSGVTIANSPLQIEQILGCMLTVGGIKDSVITKASLMRQEGLIVKNENPAVGHRITVSSYFFKTTFNGETYTLKGYGPLFSNEIKKIIKVLPPNTFISFTNARIFIDGCDRRVIKDLKILVQ